MTRRPRPKAKKPTKPLTAVQSGEVLRLVTEVMRLVAEMTPPKAAKRKRAA